LEPYDNSFWEKSKSTRKREEREKNAVNSRHFVPVTAHASCSDQHALCLHVYTLRGILAAREWGKVWPDMKSNILITSSVFRASERVSQPHLYCNYLLEPTHHHLAFVFGMLSTVRDQMPNNKMINYNPNFVVLCISPTIDFWTKCRQAP
jgi:hypothetical protein